MASPKAPIATIASLTSQTTVTDINENFDVLSDAIGRALSRFDDLDEEDILIDNEMNTDLDMNHFRIYNLDDAVEDHEPVTLGQLDDLLIVGPTGPTGPTGPQGPQGDPGATGPAGTFDATNVKNSIEIDAGDVQLVGDENTPGNNKVYGTDGAGAKGWKDDPTGGAGDVTGPVSSIDNEIVLWSGTGGDTLKSATTTGILKATSGVIGAAAAGTDYAAATSGTAILKGNGSGGFSSAVAGTDYAGLASTQIFTGQNAYRRTSGGLNVEMRTTLDGASSGPDFWIYRSRPGGVADNDELGRILFQGDDDGGNITTYGALWALSLDVTNTTEDGRLVFATMVNGSLIETMTVGPGLVVGTPTDGDKGAGTINATAIYVDGVAVGSGGGDISGPGSSTDNALATWNGTAGDDLDELAGTGVVRVDSAVATVMTSWPYDVAFYFAGLQTASTEQIFVATRAFDLAANLTNSQLKAEVAATASTVIDIQKNGSSIGTITVAAAGTTASFSVTGTSFAAGDRLHIVFPGTPDATLANIALTLAGTRAP